MISESMFATRPGKPRWWVRWLCVRIAQDGYVQCCDGHYANHSRRIFFVGETQESTARGLTNLIRKEFRFKPKRYHAIVPYHSHFYAPLWTAEAWRYLLRRG